MAAQSTQYVVDVRAGAGVATNPFVFPGGDAAAFLNLEVLPQFRYATERQSTLVRGRVSADTFIGGDYEPRVTAAASVEHSNRITERLTFDGVLEFESSEGSRANPAFFDIGLEPPGAAPIVPDIILPDPDLVGGDQQRYLLRGTTNLTYRLSERDTVQGGINIARATYPNQAIFNNFDAAGFRIQYDRALSERLSGGVRLNAQSVETEGALGEIRVITPQATGRYRVSELWTVDAALGALLIERTGGVGPDEKSTGLSGNVRACRRSPTIEFCAAATRDATTSGISGIVRRTALDAYYTRFLDADTRVQASLVVGEFKESMTVIPRVGLGDRTYLAATGLFERRLSDRVFGSATALVERADYAAFGSATNVRLQVSIGYRFGDVNYARPTRGD